MVKLLLSLPKNVLAVVVLGTAIFFIVAQDPPHSICRAQIENFKSQQKGILYENSAIKNKKGPLLKRMIKHCKENNSPGSCYGLFSKVKKLIYDFKVVSVDCREEFSALSDVRKTLFEIYSLIIRVAWGDKPPVEYQDKLHWLSEVDVSLFCLIKNRILFFYGSSALVSLEKKTFKSLPGAEDMNPVRIRELSLVSEDCAIYPSLM